MAILTSDALELNPTSIAVIGMAGRFPGSRNISEFWQHLRDGVESIRFASDAELQAAGEESAALRDPNYVRAVATLPDMEMFDASFFGLSPKDAAMMDPQHRHFLQCAWEAMEHAGHDPDRFAGTIGVYAGSGMSTYLIYNLLTNPELQGADLFLIKNTGNEKDLLATRVSYLLNLKGPSVNVQTACSTSLVAIHLACQSLLNHECDMALAGGVTIEIPHGRGYLYREGEILSKDGHCRSFGAQSSGTVFGSGVGVVVLRRLQDALADRDCIHAVVRGSAINNDGARKIGYLAPSVEGQAEVIAEALSVAGVSPDSVSYVEAHGTGTKVGDPIEIKGLTEALAGGTKRPGTCAIGSVKSNIGHLDTAAGVAGFIKTVLALEHRLLPPSLHCADPNPLIEFDKTPFFVNSKLAEWETNGEPRRAGVTSLGIGGTNAHVVLEEAPALEASAASRPWQVLVVSAKSLAALKAAAQSLASHLESDLDLNLADVAYTCQVGRRAFKNRHAFVCQSIEEAVTELRGMESRRRSSETAPAADREVAFLFPGQGSQYVNMGLDLYRFEPSFRQEVDYCAEYLLLHLETDLRSILFPSVESATTARSQMNETWITQPALFVIEYALAKLWMSWGVGPEAMLGHSIGEYVAACLAGVLSLEDALTVVAARGRMMQDLPAGAMTAVLVAEQELHPFVTGEVAIAAVNGPAQCVVSGPIDAIGQLEQTLGQRDVVCRRLHTSHAFHSPMMDPILAAFTEVMAKVSLRSPAIPYLSNVTGTWITAAEATDPAYWATHLRQAVKFNSGLTELFKAEERILLEVGPGKALTSLAQQHPQRPSRTSALASLRRPEEQTSDLKSLLTSVGQLWTSGKDIDWSAFYRHERRRRIPLPTYPFEPQRYWIKEGKHRHGLPKSEAAAPVGPVIESWFYRPTWKRSGLPASPESANDVDPRTCWLVFSDPLGLGARIVDKLRSSGHYVTTVTCGTKFANIKAGLYAIDPAERSDYDTLLSELAAQDKVPEKIVHLWSVVANESHVGRLDSYDRTQNLSFYSLLFLAQALGDQDSLDRPLDFTIVSNNLWNLAGEVAFLPERGTLLGPCRVMPKEFPAVSCRAVDVDLLLVSPQNGSGRQAEVEGATGQILAELSARTGDQVVAYRGGSRWVQTLERAEVREGSALGQLKRRGVYLVTGGLGDLGLVAAEMLARSVQARLVFVGRTAIPDKDTWEHWLRTHDPQDRTSRTIRSLRTIEQLGSETLIVRADVTDLEEMRDAVTLTRGRFGSIDGIIHAAGVLDDGIIQRKTRASADRVLSTKVKGTLVLDALFSGTNLDFLVLFSSISAIHPPAGQVDYAGANAFLDVLAQASTAKLSSHILSIDWGAWREIGMAARVSVAPPAAISKSDSERGRFHPLLGRRIDSTDETLTFSAAYSASSHWILKEHRLRQGPAVFPGTGYLELAAAALGTKDKAFEIRSVSFLAPLLFESEKKREVRIKLRREDDFYSFSVTAEPGIETTDSAKWREYASGQVGQIDLKAAQKLDLREIKNRCGLRTISFAPQRQQVKQDRYFEFGPRWKSLREISFGEEEALALLELPEEYAGDWVDYHLHPALLDMATGAAFLLIADYELSDDMCLPVSYKRLTFRAPLPRRVYSHIRLKRAESDIAVFDLTVTDKKGAPIVEIEEFCVRRIYNQELLGEGNDGGITSTIAPAQGSEVLRRVLLDDVSGNLIVSPIDLLRQQTLAGDDMEPARLPRTTPGSTFAPPRNETERSLTQWMEELLGVDQVGIHDDFFELGGHSLLAARLSARAKKTWGKEIPLAILFQAPTVAKLASVLGNGAYSLASSRIAPIQPEGSKPPFFCVDAGPLFRSLAHQVGFDQPFLGLRLADTSGLPIPYELEDIAAYHIETMRSFQHEGPYFLGGWSASGVIAYEMAQQLRVQGQVVALLVLFDTVNPAPMDGSQGQLALSPSFDYWVRKLRLHFALMRQLGANEQLSFARERLRMLHLNAARKLWQLSYRFHLGLGRRMDGWLRSPAQVVYFAAGNYRPRPYPGRMVQFPSTTTRQVGGDPRLGWGELATAGLEFWEVPGDHQNIFVEPNVRVLAKKLRACLDEAQEGDRDHHSLQTSHV